MAVSAHVQQKICFKIAEIVVQIPRFPILYNRVGNLGNWTIISADWLKVPKIMVQFRKLFWKLDHDFRYLFLQFLLQRGKSFKLVTQ